VSIDVRGDDNADAVAVLQLLPEVPSGSSGEVGDRHLRLQASEHLKVEAQLLLKSSK